MGFEITKETYAGAIKGITIGKGDTALTVGGQTSYPFYQFEGEMPNKPIVWAEACPGANASQTRFKFVGCDTDLTMSNDMIAAGLISHCQANDIPLPRTWEKSISVATSYIELRVANLSGAKPKETGDAEAAALI